MKIMKTDEPPEKFRCQFLFLADGKTKKKLYLSRRRDSHAKKSEKAKPG